MSDPVSIVDLFSGPGGLGEGFASLRGPRGPAYRIALSIEKDPAAHATLRLRAFLRRFESLPPEYVDWLRCGGPHPDWAQLYPTTWSEAEEEARCLELGTLQAGKLVDTRINELLASGQRRTLLIGGPPCQAYSLAGRSRNAGNAAYDATKDGRHFLYQEYARVLRKLKPVAFVMENVKGMLSSSVEGRAIFRAVSQDLSAAGDGYRLVALSARAGSCTEPVNQH